MNGSSRGRRTLIVVLLSTKLDLSKKVFDKVQDVEYNEIFSLVLMLKSVQIMLAIAAFYDYEIWQMDVKTAFLNGFLKDNTKKRHIRDILGRTNFFCHTYDTSMMIIVTKPGIIIDVVGSYFCDKKS